MIKIYLTADYEIFGNGSGCVDNCLLKPVGRLSHILDKHKVRMTYFVDVLEIVAFSQAEGVDKSCYPQFRKMIEQQIRDLYQAGHDIQLHFHPQWIDAAWLPAENKWKLNNQYWRLPNCPSAFEYEGLQGLVALFSFGKNYLEQLLQPLDASYQCLAFRTGSWSIQPESEVLNAMRKAGLRFDSTVAPGAFCDNGLTYFDFRKAPRNKPYWPIDKAVNQESDQKGLTEVPIFSMEAGFLQRLYWRVLKRYRKISPYPAGCDGRPAGLQLQKKTDKPRRSLAKLVDKLSSQLQMFDYCNASHNELKAFAKAAQQRYRDSEKLVPVVAIGHPKNFQNENELALFLSWLEGRSDITIDKVEDERLWHLI